MEVEIPMVNSPHFWTKKNPLVLLTYKLLKKVVIVDDLSVMGRYAEMFLHCFLVAEEALSVKY